LSIQTFVDECKAGGFSLAAASIPCRDVPRLRSVVNSLRMPMQPRLHFVDESTQKRKNVITTLTDAGGIKTVVYDARGFDDPKEGHDVAVTRMAADQAAIPASRIVVEADDSVVIAEQLIIREQLGLAGVEAIVGVDHMRAREEPLLAIPDAVVWCYTHGGEWMKLAESLIADVVTL
jgi:hypothetical protein